MRKKAAKFVPPVTKIEPPVPLERIDWEDLRYFAAMARERSQRRAALKLGVKPPTVSRRIDSLEDSLRMKLFTRTTRGLLLTDAGKRIAKFAESLDVMVRNTAAQLQTYEPELKGECKIYMSDGIAAFWFVPFFLNRFVSRHPKIVTRILAPEEGERPSFPLFDMEVRYAPSPDRQLTSERVGTMHLMYFASKSYIQRHGTPSSKADLGRHQVVDILSSVSSPSGVLATWSNSDVLGSAAVLTNSGLVIGQTVQAGVCIGPLPTYAWLVLPDLVPLFPDTHYPTGIYLNYHAGAEQHPSVRVLRDFLRDEVFDKSNMPWFDERFEPPDPRWRKTFQELSHAE